MMRKPTRFWLISAAVAMIPVGAAMAATVTFTGSPYIPLPTAVHSYSKQSPSTGFTLTFSKGQQEMLIGGSSTLATGTIKLNPSPYDGQMNCFYTKPIVTALTLSAASGQTLNDAVTATTATTRYCYLFSASNQTWDRVQ